MLSDLGSFASGTSAPLGSTNTRFLSNGTCNVEHIFYNQRLRLPVPPAGHSTLRVYLKYFLLIL